MAKAKTQPVQKRSLWRMLVHIAAFGIVALLLLAILAALVGDVQPSGNIAVIKVVGPIMGERQSAFTPVAASSDIVKLLKEAKESTEVQAIIVEINSPGGSAVASAEIADAMKGLGKPVVAVIREVGASGGYWIASAGDRIFAHELSITGSIGVISSYLNFGGLIQEYNVSYQRLVAGENKDIGTPFRALKPHEERFLQTKLDKMHEVFIRTVSENRKLPFEDVKKVADGSFMLGMEAKELGLIDAFGGRDDAITYLEAKLNITAEVAEYKTSKGFADLFAGASSGFSYGAGRGFGESFTQNTLIPLT